MTKLRIWASWKTTFILFPIAASLGTEAGAENLLGQALRAHGGLERFRSIRDWHIIADRKLEDGEASRETYEEYLLRDGGSEKTLLVKKRESAVLVFGHDGQKAFALADGRLREDDDADDEGYYRAHGEYYLRAIPFKWMDPGVRVTPAGREKAEARELDLLRISADENVGRAWKDVWVAAFDSRTHLLFEARLTHHQESGVTEITYRYGDYRDVSGLQIPHHLEYLSFGRRTGENVIRTIDIDSGVKPELFTTSYWVSRGVRSRLSPDAIVGGHEIYRRLISPTSSPLSARAARSTLP